MPNSQSDIFVRVVRNDLPLKERLLPKAFAKRMDMLAEEGVNRAKILIQNSPADGITYDRGGYSHTASSPGQPPRSDTGRLINGLHWQPRGQDRLVIASGSYPAYLEFGTTKMEPRPFMGPMARQLQQLIRPTFDKILEDD
ncbi:hypothetical protein G4Y79_15295 [Phototrophicus methaneseepsis]|uniref:HK97 gp10 family phage protein n=1 Tax=Phototrophicus methaneseepsis TaxID=2710758 RepID=A0A7S8E6A1_9CHLR|nr:hypothetical protein [Phototrophicus methaneseepsis]QPC81068.1 hypothetical protein G4Y79_15295 [Phototrophicus methaneseepsis]